MPPPTALTPVPEPCSGAGYYYVHVCNYSIHHSDCTLYLCRWHLVTYLLTSSKPSQCSDLILSRYGGHDHEGCGAETIIKISADYQADYRETCTMSHSFRFLCCGQWNAERILPWSVTKRNKTIYSEFQWKPNITITWFDYLSLEAILAIVGVIIL